MSEQALDAEPPDPVIHRTKAAERRLQGDDLGALAHLVAAQALEALAAGAPAGAAKELCDVATGYFMLEDYDTAARWYALVLRIDPTLAVAYQNLSAIYASRGQHAEAEACRTRAYGIQRVFIDPVEDPVRRVLILCVGRTAGNISFRTLLPATRCCRIKYAIDYAAEEEDAQLPPFDLVFNAIGEPDIAVSLAERLDGFARRCGRPLLNPPDRVTRTQRHRLAALMEGLDDVEVAPCLRFDHPPASRAVLAARLADEKMDFPLLLRAAAAHGGDGLARYGSMEAIETGFQNLSGAGYLTMFRDTRSPDGYYRKYRMIFVDREPFPYHLAISPQWMVHYFSADMERNPWKIAEEKRFLQDPGGSLGARGLAAVAAIGRRLDLDYGGIDFTLLPDGKIFVFEANAVMLVHRERENGVLTHKNSAVQRIVDAFDQLQDRKISKEQGSALHPPGAWGSWTSVT